jgi:hypothetical protein
MDPASTEVARLRNDITAAEEKEAKRVFIEERLNGARRGIEVKDLEKANGLLQEILRVEPEHAEAVRLSREVRDAIAYSKTGDLRYAATRRPGEIDPLMLDPGSQAPTLFVDPGKQAPPPVKREPARGKTESPSPVKPERLRPATLIARPRKKIYVVAGTVLLVAAAAVFYRTVLYVPPAPRGYVALNILPWGEVLKIVHEGGREVPLPGQTWTPCRLALPEGLYYIHVANPMFAKPLIDTVTVRNNQVQRVTKKFAGFEDGLDLSKFQ